MVSFFLVPRLWTALPAQRLKCLRDQTWIMCNRKSEFGNVLYIKKT